ncbi:hypothetical protein WJX72_003852 [[Myrmecia] bisecta]|uniref:3'-5' exonuclease n=1 Tax=[Myrmecia] bisecta TaxID=41462 RepID=A0AAW1R636_9CHLO
MYFEAANQPIAIAVEQVTDDEFSALEAALQAAEQVQTLKQAGKGAEAANSKRRQPASFQNAAAPSLPPLSYAEGKITYVYTPLEVDYHCCQLAASGVAAVGFDIEWRVTYETGKVPRNTALIQLCFARPGRGYECLLLHIAHSGLTPALRAVLTSQALLKVGVGISGDAQKLMRDFGQDCNGLVDLSEDANARLCGVGSTRCPQKWSLAGLVEELLKARLEKHNGLRCSNWEVKPLSPAQQEYAALDAFASLRVHQVLQTMPVLTVAPLPAPVLPIPQASDVQRLSVPAEAALKPLQPAKLAVYKLFFEQGLAASQIAQARHVSGRHRGGLPGRCDRRRLRLPLASAGRQPGRPH